MNQGCVGRERGRFFAGGKLWHISRILRSLDSGSFPSRCLLRTSTICSSASLLSDMWLLGGDDAASLLPSCGATSLHACVILGVSTLFCESTFPHSHTHIHTHTHPFLVKFVRVSTFDTDNHQTPPTWRTLSMRRPAKSQKPSSHC